MRVVPMSIIRESSRAWVRDQTASLSSLPHGAGPKATEFEKPGATFVSLGSKGFERNRDEGSLSCSVCSCRIRLSIALTYTGVCTSRAQSMPMRKGKTPFDLETGDVGRAQGTAPTRVVNVDDRGAL